MQFKNSIGFYRKKTGLKQQDLANKIGIKRYYLSNIENGHSLPDIKLLEDIALNLNANIGQLYPADIQDVIIKYGYENN